VTAAPAVLPDRAAPGRSPLHAGAGAALRVLLVEDNPSDALVIRALLSGAQAGISVSHVVWMREALQRLSRGTYDVVLLDIFLPDARELEALDRLRLHAPGVPIVVLTARDDEHVAVRAVRAGAQDYLCKGRIDAEILLRSIRYAIERNRLHASLEVALARRAEAEQALRSREEYFRTLIENASDLTVVVEADGTIRYVSPSAREVLGCTPEDLVGTSAFAGVHPEDLAQLKRAFIEAIRRPGLAAEAECRLRHRDGSWHTFHSVGSNQLANPSVRGLVVNARDTTARKHAETERERILSLLRATLDATADGILVVDGGGAIAGFNEQFARMWRFPPGVLERGLDAEIRAHVRHQLAEPDAFEARIDELLAHPEEEGHDVVRFTDGRVFERFTRPQQVAGLTVGRVWSFRDVTERLRLEARVQHAQKMEAVGQLAGGIAHDFNNILMTIKGVTGLLLADTGEASALGRDLLQIDESADHAATLTRQLLAFSRRQVLELEVVSLNEVIAGMEQMLGRVLGDPVAVECTLEPRIGWVRVDTSQMKQVIMNLALNARDAMEHGGVLSIRTANVEPGDPRLVNLSETTYGAVSIEVADTGGGMDDATLARVFEPFYTTKEPGRGTGLGLSTVDGIVRQSGGDIQVASAPGRGSTFTVLLPRVAEPERCALEAHPLRPGAAAGARIEDTRPRSPETVLLVEDSAPVRQIARRILERGGYRVLDASGGIEALEIAARHDGEIHLLLTDVMMPGLTGPAVVERFLRLRPSTPVVYMSGYAENALHPDWGLPAGTRLLNKPFDAAAMLASIREWLDASARPSAKPGCE